MLLIYPRPRRVFCLLLAAVQAAGAADVGKKAGAPVLPSAAPAAQTLALPRLEVSRLAAVEALPLAQAASAPAVEASLQDAAALIQALPRAQDGEQAAAYASRAFDAAAVKNGGGEIVVPKCPFHALIGSKGTAQERAAKQVVPGARAPSHPKVLKFSLALLLRRAFHALRDRVLGRDPFQGRPRPREAPMTELALMALRHLPNPAAGLVALHRRVGDVAYTQTWTGHRAFFVADPEAVDQILRETDKSHGAKFEKSELGIGGIAKLTGRGTVFLGHGARWKSRRAVMQPSFHPVVIKSEAMHDHIDGLIAQGLDDLAVRAGLGGRLGRELKLAEEMSALTMKVILGVLFDYEAPDARLRHVVGPAFAEVTRTVPAESLNPLTMRLSQLPFAYPGRAKLARAYKTLDGLAADILAAGRARSGRHGDLLDELLEAVDETGRPLTDEELKSEILTMILAGHETTSATVSWALYSLARDGEKAARLKKEIAEARASGLTAHAALRDGKIPYLGHVLSETLRLYSPAYVLFRYALEDAEVRTAGGPLFIPKGSHVVLSTFVTHRRPEQWGADATGFPAEEFHPERFDRYNLAQRGLTRKDLQTFAFGHGPRVCLGQSLSLVEAELILIRFLEKFEYEPVSVLPAKIVSDIGVKLADGLLSRVRPRP